MRWAALVTVTLGVGSWPGGEVLAEPAWNACDLVQKADLDAAFAPRVFGAGTPGRKQSPGTATMAEVSTCSFTSAGASAKEKRTVGLLARRAPSDTTGVTPQAARAGALQLKATPVDVAGLGEGAYWVNMGSSAFPVVELNVFRGRREWLIFSTSGKKLDVSAAVAGLTKLAAATLARP
jgi:hypothetical protein